LSTDFARSHAADFAARKTAENELQYSQAIKGCQLGASDLVDSWRRRVAAQLWPSVCVLCRARGQDAVDLCAACEADLPLNALACSRCAMPLHADGAHALVCGRCLRKPPAFTAAYAPYRYAYPVDSLVQGLKYRRQGACGRVLGELLARRLQQLGATCEAIIPTPLSPRRFRSRGYNQAHELARPLQALLGVAIRSDLVERVRETQEQAGLKQEERRNNVRNAFALCRPLPVRHVAILDDVITTGSTAHELARVLQRAGAVRIDLWAVARAG
jgi:ComF family protein